MMLNKRKADLSFHKGFDEQSFLAYMEEWFFLNDYTRALIENVIEYAHRHEHISKDMFADFVSDILPNIDFKEVAAFCEDGCLTASAIREKNEFWDEREADYDEKVKDLWDEFGDVPMDPVSECIEVDWHGFPAGTNRQYIWHWFEDTFDVRVADLMYN